MEGLYTWKNILYGDVADDFGESSDSTAGRYKGMV